MPLPQLFCQQYLQSDNQMHSYYFSFCFCPSDSCCQFSMSCCFCCCLPTTRLSSISCGWCNFLCFYKSCCATKVQLFGIIYVVKPVYTYVESLDKCVLLKYGTHILVSTQLLVLPACQLISISDLVNNIQDILCIFVVLTSNSSYF